MVIECILGGAALGSLIAQGVHAYYASSNMNKTVKLMEKKTDIEIDHLNKRTAIEEKRAATMQKVEERVTSLLIPSSTCVSQTASSTALEESKALWGIAGLTLGVSVTTQILRNQLLPKDAWMLGRTVDTISTIATVNALGAAAAGAFKFTTYLSGMRA